MLPTGPVGNVAVPVQAIVNASVFFENGTRIAEFDEVLNVHSFRAGIIESTDQLAPPKGVFCKNNGSQNLISLEDIGIEWPDHFSVRVEASSSRSSQWQRFHLRYDAGDRRRGRRIRYDYLPPGSEDYRSIIQDFGENLTYAVDLRTGACKIDRLMRTPEVSPTQDPIDFFIRHENRFITNEDRKNWEFNGFRCKHSLSLLTTKNPLLCFPLACRGNTVKCTVATSSIDNFPAIVDSDTGKPSGETWAATNVEYAWSMRSPLTPPAQGSKKKFDYPVHIFMRLYRFGDPSNPSPFNIRTEDVEYEFYEMSEERHSYDFDVSTCYRANNLSYAHLGMVLTMDKENGFDGNKLNRRFLEFEVHFLLANYTKVRYPRISGVEIDHIRKGSEITVFFTILGPAPAPGTAAGIDLNDISVDQARENLKKVLDDGSFKFQFPLSDNSSTSLQLTGKAGSLDAAKVYSIAQTASVKRDKKACKSQSVAVPILIGALLGILFGALLVAIVRILRPASMPNVPGLPSSFSNKLPSISYSSRKAAEAAPPTSVSQA